MEAENESNIGYIIERGVCLILSMYRHRSFFVVKYRMFTNELYVAYFGNMLHTVIVHEARN